MVRSRNRALNGDCVAWVPSSAVPARSCGPALRRGVAPPSLALATPRLAAREPTLPPSPLQATTTRGNPRDAVPVQGPTTRRTRASPRLFFPPRPVADLGRILTLAVGVVARLRAVIDHELSH